MQITNRKLLVGGGSLVSLVAFAVFCGFYPAAVAVYQPFSIAIVSLSGLYMGANVAAAHVAGKVGQP